MAKTDHGYSVAEARDIAARARELSAIPDRMESLRLESARQVGVAFAQLGRDRVKESLSRMPITELRRYGPAGLKIKALQQVGVHSVLDVVGVASSDLARLPGLGPKSAWAIEIAADNAYAAALHSTKVQIDGGAASRELLSALYRLRALALEYRGMQGDLAAATALRDDLQSAQPATSGLRMAMTRRARKARAFEAVERLDRSLSSREIQRLVRHWNELAVEATPEAVVGDFSRYVDDYHALLTALGPDQPWILAPPRAAGARPGRQEAPPAPSPGTDTRARIGPYRVERKLGSGTFGTTYLAANDSGVEVAVKVLHAEHARRPGVRATIEKEIRSGQRINSRYFARVLNYDMDAAQPWLAQAYVPGQTLEKLITREAPLPMERVRAIADQLGLALADLERFGVVHMDLKPANIQVGDSDAVTILDLGVSWAPGDEESGGTLAYSAPEILLGDEPTPAADAWAVALITAELATGRNPVLERVERDPMAGVDGRAAVLRAVKHGLDLSGVPEPLRPAVQAMTDPDPDRRPTGEEFRRWIGVTASGSDPQQEEAWVEGLAMLLDYSNTSHSTMVFDLDDDVYVQWAGNGDHLQVEVASNAFLSGRRRMNPEQERALARMGFIAPTQTGPNWWLPVSSESGFFGYERAARLILKAILEVHRVDPRRFAKEMGDDLLEARKSPNAWARRMAETDAGPDEFRFGDLLLRRRDGESDDSFSARIMAEIERAGIPIEDLTGEFS